MEALVSMFFPLAADIQNGALVCMFSAIKQNALGSIETYKAMVLVVVSLILVFKVVRLSYVIMSDEQHAGFGGVRLWDILRPLVIVLVIQNCNLFVSLFDSAVETVTFSIYRSVENMATTAKTSTGKVIEMFEYNGKTFSLKPEDNRNIANWTGTSGIEQAAKDVFGAAKDSIINARWDVHREALERESKKLRGIITIKTDGTVRDRALTDDEKAKLAALDADLTALEEREKTFKEALGEYVDCAEALTSPRSTVLGAVTWLYDRMLVVVICISDMILCCLIMFLPIVLALSIFEVWKKNVWSWVGTYVEVALWKVTGAVINWFVINARSASLKVCMSDNWKAVQSAINSQTVADYQQSGMVMLVFIGIALAGIIAIFKVPSITNAVLALGKPIGDLGLISSAITSPPKAAGGAVKMAKTLTGK